MALVQGSYEYYHYLQDGFNDSVMKNLLKNTSIILLSEVNIKWKQQGVGYYEFAAWLSSHGDIEGYPLPIIYLFILYSKALVYYV